MTYSGKEIEQGAGKRMIAETDRRALDVELCGERVFPVVGALRERGGPPGVHDGL